MEGFEAPPYFLCPISLQIMRDPVTLTTGITYDRGSIEQWIYSGKHNTCPVTKQPLPDCDLIPNHTLRRLIQSWCAAHATYGVERFPTPRPPVDKSQIAKLLEEAKSPRYRMDSLRKLKSIVSESDRNKRCVEASGAVDFLASIINKSISNSSKEEEEEEEENYEGVESTGATDEALSILYSLQITEQGLLHLMEMGFIESLTSILRHSSYQSRAYATLLLKSLLAVSVRWIGLRAELFEEMVKVLRDRISYQAMKAALRVLAGICPRGRNRVKAVEAGAVPVLIELLLEEPEKRPTEMMLEVLDQLCECAEGRAEMVGHAAGVAMVSKKILWVSKVASERAVSILHSISRLSGTPAVLKDMLEVGVVSKLCLVLQVECGTRTREQVKEILRLHSSVWWNAPCISPQLQASYPC